MEGKTHTVGGALLAVSLSPLYTNYENSVTLPSIQGLNSLPNQAIILSIIILASTFGALLPDIDHKGSKIGRMFPFISYPLSTTFGHRTLTHSLTLFVPLFLIVTSVTTIYGYSWIGIAFLLGYFSHIVLDLFTPKGIVLFYPFLKTSVKSPVTIPTGGMYEHVLRLLLLLGLGFLLINGTGSLQSIKIFF